MHRQAPGTPILSLKIPCSMSTTAPEPPPHAQTPAVFIDESGRRAGRVRLAAAVVVLASALLLAGFIGSLLRLPVLQATRPVHSLLTNLVHRRGPVESQLLKRIR